MSQQQTVSNHEVEVIWAAAERTERDPVDQELSQWAIQTLLEQGVAPCEVAIKVINENESQVLNQEYRQKDTPTNVLSFPMDSGLLDQRLLLGDIAICAQVVRKEALQQGKSHRAHFAHMVVHGVMHLLGFDHQVNSEAEEMERIETSILQTLGFDGPYE